MGHLLLSIYLIMTILPNQELSGAKFELQEETVGVCSFYKRGGLTFVLQIKVIKRQNMAYSPLLN